MRKLERVLAEFANQNIDVQQEGHHHCRPGWLQLDCPFCGRGTQKYHMGLSTDRAVFSCWRCGAHKIVDVCRELTDSSKPLIDSIFALKTGGEYTSQVDTIRASCTVPKGLQSLADLPAHKEYLRERGFNVRALRRLWRLRGYGVHSAYAWRIFIPIFYESRLVSWTTRTISPENKTRYLSAPSDHERLQAKTLLYGEDYVDRKVIITEGPTDVWTMGEGAVGTLGVSYSDSQLLKMIKYTHRTICFDPDSAGKKRANRLADELSVFGGTTTIVEIDAPDLGSASKKEVALLRRSFL